MNRYIQIKDIDNIIILLKALLLHYQPLRRLLHNSLTHLDPRSQFRQVQLKMACEIIYSPLKRSPVARFPPRLVSFKQKQIELSFRSTDRPVITQFNKTFIVGPEISRRCMLSIEIGLLRKWTIQKIGYSYLHSLSLDVPWAVFQNQRYLKNENILWNRISHF